MWEDFGTQCYGAYEEPDCICWRDVVNDAMASPWFKWMGISQHLSLKQFIKEVENCGFSKEKIVLRAYEDGAGIVIDWGLRKQFYIPKYICADWDFEELRKELDDRIKENDVNSKLKSCPFCGGVAKIFSLQELKYGGDEGFVIQCQDCHMNTATINGGYSNTIGDVVEMWNKRVQQIKQPKIGEWILCSQKMPEKQGNYLAFIQYTKDYYEIEILNYRNYEDGNGGKFVGFGDSVKAWMPLPEKP